MNIQICEDHLSSFLAFLANEARVGRDVLPSLKEISEKLGISVSSLREELQVAREMGLVEVKPRRGIRPLSYSFSPIVLKSLAFAVSVDKHMFRQFSDLRNHIEASYWYQAVSQLSKVDIEKLNTIIKNAMEKLESDPIQIPHEEHRNLHMTIFSRLDNLFVQGLLEAYWDIYETVGLSIYEDKAYLDRVWSYHRDMVEKITQGDFLSGYQALIAHMDLLFQREQLKSKLYFE